MTAKIEIRNLGKYQQRRLQWVEFASGPPRFPAFRVHTLYDLLPSNVGRTCKLDGIFTVLIRLLHMAKMMGCDCIMLYKTNLVDWTKSLLPTLKKSRTYCERPRRGHIARDCSISSTETVPLIPDILTSCWPTTNKKTKPTVAQLQETKFFQQPVRLEEGPKLRIRKLSGWNLDWCLMRFKQSWDLLKFLSHRNGDNRGYVGLSC